MSKSPLISYLTESINGASTIRAFDLTQHFILENNRLLNQNIVASQMAAGVSLWFSIRVDFLATTLLLVISFVSVLSRDWTNPIILSMLLNYSMSIQSSLCWLLQLQMSMESQMVNAERCMKMTHVIQEAVPEKDGMLDGREKWPEQGQISFKNVSLRYRPDTELVLRELTFEV